MINLAHKPLFIAIEGIDGAGGTTHSKILASTLENEGFKVYLTQEPSDSEVGVLLGGTCAQR